MPPTAPFTGVGVALVTLFDEEGEMNTPATAKPPRPGWWTPASRRWSSPVAGEAAALDVDERSDLLIAVRSAVDGRVPVIAGTGAASARQAVVLRAEPRVMVPMRCSSCPLPVSPIRGPTTSASQRRSTCPCSHTTTRCRRGSPRRRAPPSFLWPASRTAPGDAERLLLEADEISAGLYTGHATLIHLAGAIGCSGAILALANVDPEGCVRAWNGDGTSTRGLIGGHRSNALAGIAGLKPALSALHGTSPVTRVG